jgi:hypothetical protein
VPSPSLLLALWIALGVMVYVIFVGEWVEQLLEVFEEMQGEWEAEQEDPETAHPEGYAHFRSVVTLASKSLLF